MKTFMWVFEISFLSFAFYSLYGSLRSEYVFRYRLELLKEEVDFLTRAMTLGYVELEFDGLLRRYKALPDAWRMICCFRKISFFRRPLHFYYPYYFLVERGIYNRPGGSFAARWRE